MSAQEARKHQGHLRLVECPSCAEYLREIEVITSTMVSQKAAVDALTDQVERLQDGEDLRNAEKELRKLRRFIGKLQRELADQRREHPKYAEAEAIFQHWKKEIGKPRAQFTEDREKAVLKALEKYSPRQIAIAIVGAKVAAYRDERGVVHNDLELICRGRKLEGFIDRAQAWRLSQGLAPYAEELPCKPETMQGPVSR